MLYLKNMDPAFPLDVIGALSDNPHVAAKIQKVCANETDAGKGDFRLILDLATDAPIGPVAAGAGWRSSPLRGRRRRPGRRRTRRSRSAPRSPSGAR